MSKDKATFPHSSSGWMTKTAEPQGEMCHWRSGWQRWREFMGESAGRTDDLKELESSHNKLDRTEPGRTTTVPWVFCEGGSDLVCSLTQGHLFLEAGQLKQRWLRQARKPGAAQAKTVTQEVTHKITQTSFILKAAGTGTRCMNAQIKYP